MIGQIERAMLDRLTESDRAGLFGGRLRTIASYAGELTNLATAVQAMPALWVCYAGETEPRNDGAEGWHASATWMLFAATYSARGDASARLDESEGEVGSYRLLQAARAVLAGADFGLPIDPLAPGAIISEEQAEGRSIYSLALRTGYAFRSNAAASIDELADFLHMHLDWDIAPTGEVVPPLPADQADQRDDIYLTGSRR